MMGDSLQLRVAAPKEVHHEVECSHINILAVCSDKQTIHDIDDIFFFETTVFGWDDVRDVFPTALCPALSLPLLLNFLYLHVHDPPQMVSNALKVLAVARGWVRGSSGGNDLSSSRGKEDLVVGDVEYATSHPFDSQVDAPACGKAQKIIIRCCGVGIIEIFD